MKYELFANDMISIRIEAEKTTLAGDAESVVKLDTDNFTISRGREYELLEKITEVIEEFTL